MLLEVRVCDVNGNALSGNDSTIIINVDNILYIEKKEKVYHLCMVGFGRYIDKAALSKIKAELGFSSC